MTFADEIIIRAYNKLKSKGGGVKMLRFCHIYECHNISLLYSRGARDSKIGKKVAGK